MVLTAALVAAAALAVSLTAHVFAYMAEVSSAAAILAMTVVGSELQSSDDDLCLFYHLWLRALDFHLAFCSFHFAALCCLHH